VTSNGGDKLADAQISVTDQATQRTTGDLFVVRDGQSGEGTLLDKDDVASTLAINLLAPVQ